MVYYARISRILQKLRLAKLTLPASRGSRRVFEMSDQILTEPVITVTEVARQVGVVRANEPENAEKTLRIFVEEGGRGGLQHGWFSTKNGTRTTLSSFCGDRSRG